MNYGSREQNLSELGVNDTSYSNRLKHDPLGTMLRIFSIKYTEGRSDNTASTLPLLGLIKVHLGVSYGNRLYCEINIYRLILIGLEAISVCIKMHYSRVSNWAVEVLFVLKCFCPVIIFQCNTVIGPALKFMRNSEKYPRNILEKVMGLVAAHPLVPWL